MLNHNDYLFLDTSVVNAQQTRNAQLRIRPAEKSPTAPLLWEEYSADPPRSWEARFDNGYPHVFWDPSIDRYRLYYTVFIIDESSTSVSHESRPSSVYIPGSDRTAALCYAESRDGIMWEKPELGIVEFEGNAANNIVMRNAHGTSVVRDERDPNPERRYKLITKLEFSSTHHFMVVAFSDDGIHFSEPRPWPRYNPRADTHNFAYWDAQRNEFGLITRLWSNGLRVAAKSESSDFVSWSEPREVFRGQGFAEQVYSMPVVPYAQGYLGFPAMFHEGDRSSADFDTVDTRLAFSTDGEHWELVCPDQAIVGRGAGHYPDGDFDSSCIYSAAPISIGDEIALYYMGSNGPHTGYREAALGRATFEKDKFAYYEAVDSDAESLLVTTPFSLSGNTVELLVELDSEGFVEVELRKGLEQIAGFGREEFMSITEVDGWAILQFDAQKLESLGGEAVSFWIHGRHARVFAIRGALESIPRP